MSTDTPVYRFSQITKDLAVEDPIGTWVMYSEHLRAITIEQDKNTVLREALEKCAAQFRMYESMHFAKGNKEKADTNAAMANIAEKALKNND